MSLPLRKFRCAIYCRKSSEEGLGQAFNSLDAQRDACLAYIESQRREGWIAVDDPAIGRGIFLAAAVPILRGLARPFGCPGACRRSQPRPRRQGDGLQLSNLSAGSCASPKRRPLKRPMRRRAAHHRPRHTLKPAERPTPIVTDAALRPGLRCLNGLLGPNGRGDVAHHTRRRGRIYRYYVTREAIADGYDTCAVTERAGRRCRGRRSGPGPEAAGPAGARRAYLGGV